MDTSVFLKIDLEKLSYVKIIPTPSCLKKCGIYSESPTCTFNEKEAYYLFSNFNLLIHQDSVGKYNYHSLPSNYNFKPFDRKRSQDIAYSRTFELLRESNLGIFLVDKGYIILRKLERKNITERMQTELLYFSNNNIYLGSKILPFHIQNPVSFQGKLFVVNDSFTKAFIYGPK